MMPLHISCHDAFHFHYCRCHFADAGISYAIISPLRHATLIFDISAFAIISLPIFIIAIIALRFSCRCWLIADAITLIALPLSIIIR
jgi:hypothetical protein